jgi:multisubunit Na+/H+ antiporter MnhC subunit
MRKSTTLIAFLCAWMWAGDAHAYLDPGTGSFIIQAVVAGVATTLFLLKLYYSRLKAAFKRWFGPRGVKDSE